MPGLVGFSLRKPLDEFAELLGRMMSAITYNEADQSDSFTDQKAGVAFGRVSLGVFNAYAQPLSSDDGLVQVIFDGELYGNRSGKSDAQLMLDLYLERGDALVEQVEGGLQLSYLRPEATAPQNL